MILIVGRTAVGKDTLAEKLKRKGLVQLKSYATRPKRTPDEDTHIFIPKEAAATFHDKVATTTIAGNEYFATASQVKNSDVYIIDPDGLYELTANMPETDFILVHITSDMADAIEHAVKRATDPEKEKEIISKRIASEDERFAKFEKRVAAHDLPANIKSVISVRNTYEPDSFDECIGVLCRMYAPYPKKDQCVMLDRNDQVVPSRIGLVAKDGRLQIGRNWYRFGTNEDGTVVRRPNADEAKALWKHDTAVALANAMIRNAESMRGADLSEIRRIIEKYELVKF